MTAQAEQGELVLTGPVLTCNHPYANHVHGTHEAYDQDRCRCRPCKDASALRTRLIRKGASRLVDVEPVRSRARELAAVMGPRELARVAGLPISTISTLIGHERRWTVHVDTAQKIMAVDPEERTSRTDSAEATRMLRALTRNGWSVPALTRRCSVPESTLRRLISGVGARVATEVDEEVARLYRMLCDVEAPRGTREERIAATRAVNKAVAAGWPGPSEMAGDTPVREVTMVPSRMAMWRLRALVSCGWSLESLAPQVGFSSGRLGLIVNGRTQRLSADADRAVADAYDRLWDQAPTGSPQVVARSMNRGRSQRWPMPMDIDDAQLVADEDYCPRRSMPTRRTARRTSG